MREAYWTLYNQAYVGTPELTAAFPDFPDEGEHRFARAELEMFI